MSDVTPLLKVRDLTVTFRSHRRRLSAVAGVSFDIFEGETLGLVGESGCGKSTTGKALMRIVEPSSGSIELEGVELTKQKGAALRNLRTRMQMIFQDPISSLNPRRRVKDIVAEPLDCWKSVQGEERDRIVNDLLNKVGIDPEVYGTATRDGVRAASASASPDPRAPSPCVRKLLICDEMVSALDVSVQAQILNLLEDLKAEYGLHAVSSSPTTSPGGEERLGPCRRHVLSARSVRLDRPTCCSDAPEHPYARSSCSGRHSRPIPTRPCTAKCSVASRPVRSILRVAVAFARAVPSRPKSAPR